MLDKHIEKKLFDYEDLIKPIKEIGDSISKKFNGEKIVLVCVLKGAITFYGHLLKYIHGATVETDYIHVKSYNGTKNNEREVKLIAKHTTNVTNKNVIIIEDIVDTGYTMEFLYEYFKEHGAKTVSSAVLANKPTARKVKIEPTWYGIDLPNQYVVGFGFDLHDDLRHLPYIGTLKKEYY
ncbi:hypoxanthine phosphoribosyltransferase [Mycoplasma todarodis]|nr:hypoxanthine phosphoribosyltransferase [Mycoplasma todarodis]